MILVLHVLFISCTFIVVLYADELAFEWVWGVRHTLPARLIRTLHRVVAWGFLGIVVTGVLLALPRLHFLLADPVFYVKMAFVLALGINAISIESLSAHATAHPFTHIPKRKKKWFYLSGAVSTLGWLGAIVCGLLLG